MIEEGARYASGRPSTSGLSALDEPVRVGPPFPLSDVWRPRIVNKNPIGARIGPREHDDMFCPMHPEGPMLPQPLFYRPQCRRLGRNRAQADRLCQPPNLRVLQPGVCLVDGLELGDLGRSGMGSESRQRRSALPLNQHLGRSVPARPRLRLRDQRNARYLIHVGSIPLPRPWGQLDGTGSTAERDGARGCSRAPTETALRVAFETA